MWIEIPVETRHAVVTAPTGSGKTTAAARYAYRLWKTGAVDRVVFAVPTRAAATEVQGILSRFFGEENVGRDDSDARLEDDWSMSRVWSRPAVVATYERADSVISPRPELLKRAVLVIDEAHNMANPGRSLAIQSLLAAARMVEAEMGGEPRIILLSATFPEAREVAAWLGARLNEGRDRPIPIETIVVKTGYTPPGLRGHLRFKLAAFAMKAGDLAKWLPAPILVYVPSRRGAEYAARFINENDPELAPAVYHHAGLPLAERRRIEEMLRRPDPPFRTVVATDTLSQSINTRVATVILPVFYYFRRRGREPIPAENIAQVMGRAGRPGMQEKGYVVALVEDEYEAMKFENALRGYWSRVKEPADYPALYARLLYLGRDPRVYARYAYKVDASKFGEAAHFLKTVGLVDGEGRLTRLGVLYAREYLSTADVGFLHAVKAFSGTAARFGVVGVLALSALFPELRGDLLPLARNFDFAHLILDYSLVKAVAPVLRAFVSNREGVGAVARAVEAAYESGFTEREYESRDAELVVSLAFSQPLTLLALSNPDELPADSVAEAARKGAQVIATAARMGLAPAVAADYAGLVMAALREYRRLLQRNRIREAASLIRKLASAPAHAAKEREPV